MANITAREPLTERGCFISGWALRQPRPGAKGCQPLDSVGFSPSRKTRQLRKKRTVQTCARPGLLPCEVPFRRRFIAVLGCPLIRDPFSQRGRPLQPFIALTAPEIPKRAGGNAPVRRHACCHAARQSRPLTRKWRNEGFLFGVCSNPFRFRSSLPSSPARLHPGDGREP